MSGTPMLRSLQPFVYRYPIAQPVTTSFGVMHDRPALFIRAEDDQGRVGWGEAWCNFPSVGAEHRARLVSQVLGPLIVGQPCGDVAAVFARLTERTAVLALQSGEAGPFAQAIAGIDIALWDLAAQRASQPLWKLLGGTSPTIGVYASGINPDGAEATARRMRDLGHLAFKLKVGFAPEVDRANLEALRTTLGPAVTLAVDANQAWTVDEALARAPDLRRHDLAWLEEPIRADRPLAEWAALATAMGVPLAAGENLAGLATFDLAMRSRALRVVQPDVAKWGGITGALQVARAALFAGLRFCPHYLGGGIGLLASAHLLAAAGGDGLLEIDSNENPLRDELCGDVRHVSAGKVTLGTAPGLGPAPDLTPFERYRVRV